jgi:CheY-like chemotaxis protein
MEKIIVMADPGQIDQVLINLATNARDAMPQGGKLSITTAVVDLELNSPWIKEGFHPGRYACLTVTDTGIGFDDATRLRIFDPFFTTKEVGKGTGLGLSVVYGIVRQHSGFINVSSTEGNGSIFSLYLPLIETAVEPVRGDQITLPKGNYETVLLAEDEEIVRSFARELLQAYHYRVIEASNGEEALQRFLDNQDEVDILLLDVIMPKMNGKELYDRVRAVRSNVRAVFISGYTNEILNRKVILDEGIHFVAKPLHPSELLNKLRQVLEG